METDSRIDQPKVGDFDNLHPAENVSTKDKSDANSFSKFGSGEFIQQEGNFSGTNELSQPITNEKSEPVGLIDPSDSMIAVESKSRVVDETNEDPTEKNNVNHHAGSEKITPADLNVDVEPGIILESGDNNLETSKFKERENVDIISNDTGTSGIENGNPETISQKMPEDREFKANENGNTDIQSHQNPQGSNEPNSLEDHDSVHAPEDHNSGSSPDQDSAHAPEDEWMDILGSGHLLKKIIKPGTPDTRPSKSDLCVLSFIGRLEDGTVVEKVDNMKIHLSDNEVIQGLDFALALMDKGEEAELKIGPRFAYGSLGRKPDIPSGATLFYEIKLIDVQEEPLISTLSVSERISTGLQKKERGNWWYSRDEHSLAINCYRRALEYFDDTEIPGEHNEEDVKRLLEERLKTYNNLGASQMKINAFDAALMSVNNVLLSQPKNVKALFRKSKILREKGEIQEAIDTVRQGLSYDPDSQALQQELSSLLAVQRKANSKQRELYKKMMGTSSTQEKDEDKKKASKNSYSTIKWATLIGFAACVLGAMAVKYKNF